MNESRVINKASLIAFCILYSVRKEYRKVPITITQLSVTFQKFGYRVNPRLILRDGIKYKKLLIHDRTSLERI